MRLNRYIINETRVSDSTTKVFNLRKDDILQDCKKYFKLVQGDLLYRGSNKNIGRYSIEIFKTRKDRYPKDMSEYIHDKLDDMFKQKFGWKARSEGVFATGNLDEASEYGIGTFIFLPAGDFEFLWSPTIDDLYIKMKRYKEDIYDIDNAYNNWNDIYGENQDGHWEYEGEKYDSRKDAEKQHPKNFHISDLEWIPAMTFDDYIEKLEEKLDDYLLNTVKLYKKTDLNKAIDSENEIMFKCKEYYLLDIKFENDIIQLMHEMR